MLDTLLVFSHLRWNFVYQRPQHLLSRLARYFRVYFIEEPIYQPGAASMDVTTDASGVRICVPRTARRANGFHDDQIEALQDLVDQLISEEKLENYAVWFYTPMALPLIHSCEPQLIVYDCMDELSAFLNAPKQLLQRERALLRRADIVFTGGPSLYRAKSGSHPFVHCFPSSVDAPHFARASRAGEEHSAQKHIGRPRIGFFGVIDERIDSALLGELAEARPDWQIVMVGPTVKVSPASLPRNPNIHYLGQQPYGELPDLLRGWDVCLLPFALNEATRYISPTKTLEYMAAGKPIVSTPITDVVEPYGDLVRIAATADELLQACVESLEESDSDRERRQAAMRERVRRTSWDSTVQQMRDLIQAGKRTSSRRSWNEATAGESARTRRVPLFPAESSLNTGSTDAPDIVIGAGPTGLSAAYHLGKNALLLEAASAVGGLCRSIREKGYTFDQAGHIMFSNDPYVLGLYDKLLADNVHWQNREAWIHSNGIETRYPFQGALYGLPPDVLKECLVGAIEAHFGPLGRKPHSHSAGASHACAGKAESLTDCCADGTVDMPAAERAAGNPRRLPRAVPSNFEEFIYSVWGAGVAKHFAIPYNRKLWTVPLTEIETSWLGGRVPLPDLEEMIEGALRPVPKPVGPNARFGYPLRGGFQALMDGFLPLLEGTLKLDAEVVRVLPSERRVILRDGTSYDYDHLISTAPLPRLIEMIGDEAPAPVRQAVGQLRHVSVRCVNLGVSRSHVTDKHWIYYPGPTVFHRIFVQGNASPHCNPPGGFGLTCEITYAPSKPLPCEGDDLIDLCIADCVRVGLLRPDDEVAVRNQVDLPYAYVIYDHGRKRNVDLIRSWLEPQQILLAGRYAQWEYYNSDHAFIAGKQAAETVLAARRTPAPAKTADGEGKAAHQAS